MKKYKIQNGERATFYVRDNRGNLHRFYLNREDDIFYLRFAGHDYVELPTYYDYAYTHGGILFRLAVQKSWDYISTF